MESIPRGLLIVMPGKPFMEWLNRIDPKHPVTLDMLQDNPAVYLIPEYEEDQEAYEYLWDYCEVIFRQQLMMWHTDEKKWPKDLTWDVFKDWFELKLHSEVFDVAEDAESADWTEEL